MGAHILYAITVPKGTVDKAMVWMAYAIQYIQYISLYVPITDVKGRYGRKEWEEGKATKKGEKQIFIRQY